MSLAYVEESYELLKERKSYLPHNYPKSSFEGVETADFIDLYEIFKTWIKSYHKTQLLKVQVDKKEYVVVKPITVKVYCDEDLFFAENENLVVCGTGETQEEAINDMGLHIIHFYEYYNNIEEDKLIGDALRLKRLYEDLFIEK